MAEIVLVHSHLKKWRSGGIRTHLGLNPPQQGSAGDATRGLSERKGDRSWGPEATFGRQRVPENSDRPSATPSSLRIASVSESEAVALEKVARCLTAVANLTRLGMLEFCLEPRTFTEIIKFFKMNPASFKFHDDLLQSEGLLGKEGRNRRTRYRTTAIGRLLLDIIRGPLRNALAE